MMRNARPASVLWLAFGAGVLALLAAPAGGVAIHWSGQGVPPGTTTPEVYSVATALIVLAVGLFAPSRAREERRPRLDIAVAVLFSAFSALQGLFGLTVLPALALSAMLAAAAYLIAVRNAPSA